MRTIERVGWGFAAAVALLVGLGAGHGAADMRSDRRFRESVDRLSTEREHLRVEKNRQIRDLEDMLHGADDEIERQASTIAALRSRRPVAVAAVASELAGTTDHETITEADEFGAVACMAGPIEVGRATYQAGELACTTYGLRHRVSLAIGERDSSAIVEVATSEDPEWIEVAVDELAVTTLTEKPRIFAPVLYLGVTGAVTIPTPAPELLASMTLTLFHPSSTVDVLGVRVSGNTEQARIGIDAIGYNIGAHLPVVEDVWLFAGASYGTRGDWSADLTIGTRL